MTRARLGQGDGVACVADALGVSEPTLARWLRPGSEPVLRRVAVTADPVTPAGAMSPVILVTPHGVRVEGFDRETLIAVLRALG